MVSFREWHAGRPTYTEPVVERIVLADTLRGDDGYAALAMCHGGMLHEIRPPLANGPS